MCDCPANVRTHRALGALCALLWLAACGGGGYDTTQQLAFDQAAQDPPAKLTPAVYVPQPAPSPAPTPAPPPAPGDAPLGGPPGYSRKVLDDNFGAKDPGANITSVAQFNPSTPYGSKGTGWDRWMHYGGEPKGIYANVAMKDGWLEIYPTNNDTMGMIVSHFEFLPQGAERFYVELRGQTGRGSYHGNGVVTTWPAFWFFPGNGDSDTNWGKSEYDGMEVYVNVAHGSTRDANGLYTRYFTMTSHTAPMAKIVEGPVSFMTDNDITTTWNTYGWEFYRGAGGKLFMDTYFNGKKVPGLVQGLDWTDTPPAIILGWNGGASINSPAVMKIDWVKVWKK